MMTRQEKLIEARRLLSLRKNEECRRLVLEVLKEEPANPTALGLFELLNSHLSKKNAVLRPRTKRARGSSPDPESSSNSSSRIMKSPRANHAIKRQDSQEEIDPQFAFLLNLPGNSTGSSLLPQLPFQKTPSPLPAPATMQERTISALVDLVQDQGRTLKEWIDPRFQPSLRETQAPRLQPPFPHQKKSADENYPIKKLGLKARLKKLFSKPKRVR
jgi:hypothetical protein